MKKLKAPLAIVIMSCIMFNMHAQELNSVYKYRITAYKKGNEQVFSQSNIAEVSPAFSLYIPNSFTPNNDGLNDTFGVVGEGISELGIEIYTRWGEKIFESDDSNQQWDGKFNGILSDEGVYTYLVFAKGDRKRLKKTGTVTLVSK